MHCHALPCTARHCQALPCPAIHCLEERDAGKRLADKTEKELDKAVNEGAELRKKNKELEEQAASSNEPKPNKHKEQGKERRG